MKFIEVQVQLHKNFVDSTPVAIEPDVTCLVGKNESSKTAMLRAFYNLNPAYPQDIDLDVTGDYSRWRRTRDAKQGALEELSPVRGVFELEESDRGAISEVIGIELPGDVRVIAERNYHRELTIALEVDEHCLVGSLVDQVSMDEGREKGARSCQTVEELKGFIKGTRADTPKENKATLNALKTLSSLTNNAANLLEDPEDEVEKVLLERLPKFFYFSDYSNLKGRLDLTDLLSKDPEQMSTHERTAFSLLKLAGVEGQEFTAEDFECRIAELEAAANSITQEVFEHWSQNEDLMVSFVADSDTVATSHGPTVVHRYVDIRLNDLRHQVATNLDRRSAGFRWFFSFIAAFSEFERGDRNVVPEPAQEASTRAIANKSPDSPSLFSLFTKFPSWSLVLSTHPKASPRRCEEEGATAVTPARKGASVLAGGA